MKNWLSGTPVYIVATLFSIGVVVLLGGGAPWIIDT